MFVEVYYRRNVEDERATGRKDERKKFNCCKQFLWCAFYVRIEYPRIQFRARRWCRRFHVVSQLDLWLEDSTLVINRECFHTAISAAVFWTVGVVGREFLCAPRRYSHSSGSGVSALMITKQRSFFPILKILSESNLNSLLPLLAAP